MKPSNGKKAAFHTSSIALLMLTMLFSSPLLASKFSAGDAWQERAEFKLKSDTSHRLWEKGRFPHIVVADNGEYRKDKKWKDKSWKDKDRKRRFDSLSPEEQEKIRERRKAFKSLPPEEQERIERAREKFRNLPPERREEIREKWRNMSPEQRKEYHRRMENDERNRNYR